MKSQWNHKVVNLPFNLLISQRQHVSHELVAHLLRLELKSKRFDLYFVHFNTIIYREARCPNKGYRIIRIIFINSSSVSIISLQKNILYIIFYTVIVECCVIASLQVLVIVYSVCNATLIFSPVLRITQYKGSLSITCFFLLKLIFLGLIGPPWAGARTCSNAVFRS